MRKHQTLSIGDLAKATMGWSDLIVEWTATKELKVRVPNPATLDFQAANFADIRITINAIATTVSDSSTLTTH
jgi:hypothetical protein